MKYINLRTKELFSEDYPRDNPDIDIFTPEIRTTRIKRIESADIYNECEDSDEGVSLKSFIDYFNRLYASLSEDVKDKCVIHFDTYRVYDSDYEAVLVINKYDYETVDQFCERKQKERKREINVLKRQLEDITRNLDRLIAQDEGQ